MDTQFEKLGAVISSFTLGAISAKDARETFSDEDALLLSKIREVETVTNIATAGDLVLKTLCALGLEISGTNNQDDSTSSVVNLVPCNDAVEMQTLWKLTTKTASQAKTFNEISATRSIFEDKSRDSKSDENFDKILKLITLLCDCERRVQELTETQQKQKAKKIRINQQLMKETHDFAEELDAQRIELENKSNIDKDAKVELLQKIHAKLRKTNTTRMLTNILLITSGIDFKDNPPYKKLLRLCRTPATMESL